MSRLDSLMREHCPGGVPSLALGDIAELVRGNGMPKTELTGSGVGAIHYGQIYTRYRTSTSETISFVSPESALKLAKADPGDVIITNTSENIEDVCKAVAWLGTTQIVTGGHATVIKHDQDPKYLSYWFQTPAFARQKRALASGTKVIDVSANQLLKVLIPLPPLEAQREIVRILDQFTELEAELEAELRARARQYHHYRRRLVSHRHDRRALTLGEIGPVRMCKRVFKNETSAEGAVPFFKIGTFGDEPDAFISRELFDRYRRLYSFPRPGDVLISAAGTIGRAVVYDGRDAYFQDSNIVWIENDGTRVTNRYLKHLYELMDWSTDGGTIRRLYNDRIRNTAIHVPSLAEQEDIANSLDGLDLLLNDLSVGLPAELAARRRQYEYYRDKLLTFEEKQ
ncbi:restriction endonuclease subunit S [Tessaracoccus sp. Y1736]